MTNPKSPASGTKPHYLTKNAGKTGKQYETGSRSTSDTLYQDKFRMDEGVEYKEGNSK